MYPEIKIAGGFSNALNLEFEKINSTLRVSDKIIMRVESGHKFSQVSTAAKEKLYLSDFWRNGVCLAHTQTSDISDIARAIDFWLCQDILTSELAGKYDFVYPYPKAVAFDENKEVEYTWNCLLADDSLGLGEIVKHSIKDEVLSKLFPFTSLYTLCFSRCTGYPYDTANLPNVTPKQFKHFATQEYIIRAGEDRGSETLESLFVVTKNWKEYIGEGNAEAAVKIVRANLPYDINPAVKGTADD